MKEHKKMLNGKRDTTLEQKKTMYMVQKISNQMRVLLILIIVLLSAVINTANAEVPEFSIHLSVPAVLQAINYTTSKGEYRGNCQAAVVEMVGRYKNITLSGAQNQFVIRQYYNNNNRTIGRLLTKFLPHYTCVMKSKASFNQFAFDVIRSLQNGSPVIIDLQRSENEAAMTRAIGYSAGGHYVVLNGISVKNGEYYIDTTDPYGGSSTWKKIFNDNKLTKCKDTNDGGKIYPDSVLNSFVGLGIIRNGKGKLTDLYAAMNHYCCDQTKKWPETELVGVGIFNRNDETRTEPKESSKLVKSYSKGERVSIVGRAMNSALNIWYKTDSGTYVYSGDVSFSPGEPVTEDPDVQVWKTATKNIDAYSSPYSNAVSGTIAKGDAIIICAKLYDSKTDINWFITADGMYIKDSDVGKLNTFNNYKLQGSGDKQCDVNFTVKANISLLSPLSGILYNEPYSDSIILHMANKSDEMKAVAVVKNKNNEFWVQVLLEGKTYYICAKNVSEVDDNADPINFTNRQVPSGDYKLTEQYIRLGGTISSRYSIYSAYAFWCLPDGSPILNASVPVINKTSFGIRDKGGINDQLTYSTLKKERGKGTYYYEIQVQYYKFKKVNNAKDLPLDLLTWTSNRYYFTVDGGSPDGTQFGDVVSPISVTSVKLDASSVTLSKGATHSLNVTVEPSNATNKGIEWSSTNATVATVENGKVTAAGVGTATITAKAADGSGKQATFAVTVIQPATSITVDQASGIEEIYPGNTLQLTKTVVPADAKQDVTWSSSNMSVATVSNSGLVTAISAGTATITAKATDDSGRQGVYQITVLAYVDAVTLSGSNSVNIGDSIKLTPSLSPEDAADKSLTWSSSNTNVATVDEKGNVRGVAVGTVTITATAVDRGTKSGTFSITVLQPVTKIGISGDSSVLKGNTLILSSMITPADASNKTISWSSDNTSIATINNGVVTGVASGNVTIWASATDGSGIKTPYSVRVLEPVTGITISGDTVVPVNGTVNLNATVTPENADIRMLNWTSSSSAVVSVNSQGVVTGLQPGTATIIASTTDGSGVSQEYSIQVVRQVIAVKIEGENLVHTGSTAQLTAVVASDEPLTDTSVSWSTSDPSVVTVDSSGLLTGKGNGTAIITAISNAENYYYAQHRVTIDTLVSKITVSGTSKVDAGNTTQLSVSVTPAAATNKTLTWTSSNEAVAVVNGNGLVTAVSEGTATITATATDGSSVKGTLVITVYPLPKSVTISGESNLLVNTTVQLSATIFPANTRNKNLTWSSSDTSVATVNASGFVTAKGNGSAIITATAAGNTAVTAQHEVIVSTLVSEVTLDAPERIDVGKMGTVTATIMPETASNKQVIWTSSDEEIAVVDANGNVFGISGGYVIITAKTIDSSEIAVEAEIQIFQYANSISLDINPIAYTGNTFYPTSIILPDDASEPYVNWTTSNDSILRIDRNDSDGVEFISCVNPGIARLTATTTDGSNVSGYAYVQVLPYTELTRNTAVYNIYTSGEVNSRIGRVSLTADSSSRSAEDKHGAVWHIEHVSGDYAAALGINEQIYSYSGFSLSNSVDLMLLGINSTGSDTYRVTCTINGQTDTCLVTVNVEEPTAPLPESISLSTTTYSAGVGEEIAVDITPVVSPATAALPADANPFLYGVDSFNRYAQVTMGDDVFTVTFSKAGVYTAYVRYEGSNYQYDAYATFVITTPEGTVPLEIESLSIVNSLMYMLPGETSKFDVGIYPAGADETTLLWSSSDPDVVTVAADGTMTAVSTGTSTITVSAGNGISATGIVAVTESLLSIDWNPNNIIEVYVGGESRTVIRKVYLTARASAQLTTAPAWTIKRQNGDNLTLICEPITATNANGDLLYGCAIILKSVSNVGTTEYELTCSDGNYTASTTILVNANSVEDTLPSLVQWNNMTFTGNVNQRMSIYPVVQCWPTGTMLPDEVTISIEGDSYWNTALKASEYTVSRGMITMAFSDPGVYTANVIYSCSNMRYLVPIIVRVADSSGNVPVRLMQLTLNETEISIKPGDSAQLITAFAPSDATNKAVTWSSDNPSIATVSTDGLVIGVTNGRANITCTPADDNCNPVTCVVIVEDTFTVTKYQEMDYQYLQGDVGEPVAGFRLSNGTAKRVESEGLTPVWTLTRVSGNAAGVELREHNGTQFIVVTDLISGGTDTYQVTCTAGDYSWTGHASLEVHDLGASAPTNVTLAETIYTTLIGEEVTLDFTPVCEPAGTSIPSELDAEYIGIGDIYSGLEDAYQYSLFTAGDRFSLGFKKPGTYLLSRQYRSCNLTYVTECAIIVDDGAFNLIKCTDEDAVVYIGGQSSIASTCIIRDTSIEELYGDQLTWSAERLLGDCLTVALRADQSSASLYVVNAKEEGEEVWRVSCTFKGITDYVDITIHAVQARTELPESATLYQTDFDGMIGNAITVPLAVECNPEGTSLPVTDDSAWSFSTDGNTKAHTIWSIENNQMKIVFSESGYYGGNLIYQSGNVSYHFPITFAITDEESVQAEPVNLAISLSEDSVTVYPEGETQVAIVNAVLTDSLDAYSLASVAAYAERNNAAWSVQLLSGNSCSLSINSTSVAGVQLVLDSITGSGDVTYQIQCSVAGKTISAQGTIHVATSSEARPKPEMKQNYFTTPTGKVLSIDASMYDHTHTIKLCSGKDSIWNNANALAAIGYEYDVSGDQLLPVFYEAGSYITTITNRIGNLVFTKEVIIAVYSARALPAAPSRLSFPSALAEIEDEAFENINVNIIDLRGTQISRIGSRAFADNHVLMRVYIPAGVITISTDAFSGCNDFVICCTEGSYADTWAQGMKYPIVYNME